MLYLFLHTLAIYITSIITGVGIQTFDIKSVLTALAVAVVIALLNLTVKPLITIITLPIHILTFGLLSFVINGLCVKIASIIVPDFIIPSFYMAIWFAFILSIINWVFDKFRK